MCIKDFFILDEYGHIIDVRDEVKERMDKITKKEEIIELFIEMLKVIQNDLMCKISLCLH